MGENKFKTAAAKLLAQHVGIADKQEKPAPPPATPVKRQEPVIAAQPAPEIDFVWQNEQSDATVSPSEVIVAPVSQPPAKSPFTLSRALIVLVHAGIGGAIMVDMVRPLFFGIVGNAALGFVVGALIGIIVAKKL